MDALNSRSRMPESEYISYVVMVSDKQTLKINSSRHQQWLKSVRWIANDLKAYPLKSSGPVGDEPIHELLVQYARQITRRNVLEFVLC